MARRPSAAKQCEACFETSQATSCKLGSTRKGYRWQRVIEILISRPLGCCFRSRGRNPKRATNLHFKNGVPLPSPRPIRGRWMGAGARATHKVRVVGPRCAGFPSTGGLGTLKEATPARISTTPVYPPTELSLSLSPTELSLSLSLPLSPYRPLSISLSLSRSLSLSISRSISRSLSRSLSPSLSLSLSLYLSLSLAASIMDRIDHGPIIFPRIDGLDIAICDGSIVDR